LVFLLSWVLNNRAFFVEAVRGNLLLYRSLSRIAAVSGRQYKLEIDLDQTDLSLAWFGGN